MSRAARDRASRLREHHDSLQEWHETHSKDSARRVILASRKYDEKTFRRAAEINVGQLDDEKAEREDLLRRFPVRIEKISEETITVPIVKKEENNGE